MALRGPGELKTRKISQKLANSETPSALLLIPAADRFREADL